jgi:hypothetical protein
VEEERAGDGVEGGCVFGTVGVAIFAQEDNCSWEWEISFFSPAKLLQDPAS